jgi:hypothetical protein
MGFHMASTDEPTRPAHREGIELRVAAAIASVFTRYPHLTGFVLQPPAQDSGELAVADVGFAVELAEPAREKVLEQIRATVSQLVSERPEALELLSERTFARTFH